MVIVAVVFTVIPKLIQSFAQTGEVAIKEDALFNAISHMALVTAYPWDGGDEANASYIRTTTNGHPDFNCTADGYRQGGFVGGRRCGDSNISASPISGGGPPFNSIGDFDGDSTTTFIEECAPELYEMNTTVEYVRDDNVSDNSVAGTSNSKRIIVKVYYDAGFNKGTTGEIRCITQLETYSYNIGLATINSRAW
jgi:hypothetical protein